MQRSHALLAAALLLCSAAEPPRSPLLGDDFTKYRSSAEVRRNIGRARLYSEVLHPELLALDRSVQYRGHGTLRLDQPGGVRDTPELFVNLPSPTTTFWFRMTIRYSPGWTDTGTLPREQSSNAYKLIGWGWANGFEDRGTLDFSNTTEYQLSMGLKPAGATGGGIFDLVRAGHASSEWSSGEWITYVVHYEHSGPSAMRARLWIGRSDERPALRGELRVAVPERLGVAPKVDRVQFLYTFNQVRRPDQAQSIWLGEWSVYDGHEEDPYGILGDMR